MFRSKRISLVLMGAVACAAVGCSPSQRQAPPPTQAGPPAPVADAAPVFFDLSAFTNTGDTGSRQRGLHLFNMPVSDTFRTTTTNGRSCATCHRTGDGFGLGAQTAATRPPHEPLIAQVMADADPTLPPGVANQDELKAVMLDQLRNVGMIRIILGNPTVALQPPGPDNPALIRTFRAVPTVFNAALGMEEATRTAGGGTFTGFTMWDGREPSLEHQAGSATLGHAQFDSKTPTDDRQWLDTNGVTADIAAFEKFMLSEPKQLASRSWQKPRENPALKNTPFEGAPVFDLDTVEQEFFSTVNFTDEAQRRGMRVFTGTPERPACIVCHNMPETLAGGTRLFTDARVGQENTQPRLAPPSAEVRPVMEQMGFRFLEGGLVQQLPTQRLRLKRGDAWVTVETQDPGLAGQTGRYEDLNKFKTSQLRGIGKFPRFYHDNHERDMDGVVHHYEEQFPELFQFTPQERADLIAFLNAL